MTSHQKASASTLPAPHAPRLTSLLAIAGLLTVLLAYGCGGRRPAFNDYYPTKDPRFTQKTPSGEECRNLSEDFCKNHKRFCKYAMTYLWATDKDGKFIQAENGEYYIIGLILPPTIFGKDAKHANLINPRFIYNKPTTRSQIRKASGGTIVADNAEAQSLSQEVFKAFNKLLEEGLKKNATPQTAQPLELPPELRAQLIKELQDVTGIKDVEKILEAVRKKKAAKMDHTQATIK